MDAGLGAGAAQVLLEALKARRHGRGAGQVVEPVGGAQIGQGEGPASPGARERDGAQAGDAPVAVHRVQGGHAPQALAQRGLAGGELLELRGVLQEGD